MVDAAATTKRGTTAAMEVAVPDAGVDNKATRPAVRGLYDGRRTWWAESGDMGDLPWHGLAAFGLLTCPSKFENHNRALFVY